MPEKGNFSLTNPKFIIGVPEFDYNRAKMYTTTFALGCLFSALLIWGLICYTTPYEQKSIHYSGCGCKMDKHGKIVVYGDHPPEIHREEMSPVRRHIAILKRWKMGGRRRHWQDAGAGADAGAGTGAGAREEWHEMH